MGRYLLRRREDRQQQGDGPLDGAQHGCLLRQYGHGGDRRLPGCRSGVRGGIVGQLRGRMSFLPGLLSVAHAVALRSARHGRRGHSHHRQGSQNVGGDVRRTREDGRLLSGHHRRSGPGRGASHADRQPPRDRLVGQGFPGQGVPLRGTERQGEDRSRRLYP